MDTLISFYNEISQLNPKVGSISMHQISFIQDFMRQNPNVTNILETGFHIGFSAAVFLNENPNCKVVSFDIFWFDYTRKAKLILDKHYPGRNILLAGNSVNSLPTFFDLNPSYTPDFVFIDGGHEGEVPLVDLKHIMSKIKPGTYVMIDDYCQEHGTHGVIEAVDTIIREELLENITVYKAADRGWVLGQRSSKPFTYSIDNTLKMKLLSEMHSHYDY